MHTQPETEQDWIIHVLNIHGTFFERCCQKIVAGTEGWKVKSANYPVEYPCAKWLRARKREQPRYLGAA